MRMQNGLWAAATLRLPSRVESARVELSKGGLRLEASKAQILGGLALKLRGCDCFVPRERVAGGPLAHGRVVVANQLRNSARHSLVSRRRRWGVCIRSTRRFHLRGFLPSPTRFRSISTRVSRYCRSSSSVG